MFLLLAILIPWSHHIDWSFVFNPFFWEFEAMRISGLFFMTPTSRLSMDCYSSVPFSSCSTAASSVWAPERWARPELAGTLCSFALLALGHVAGSRVVLAKMVSGAFTTITTDNSYVIETFKCSLPYKYRFCKCMFRVQEKLLYYTHSLDHVSTPVTSTQQSSSLCVLLQALFTDMIPPSRPDYLALNLSGQESGSYNNSKQWRRQSCWRVSNGQLWTFFRCPPVPHCSCIQPFSSA